jgi:hypothetical protein
MGKSIILLCVSVIFWSSLFAQIDTSERFMKAAEYLRSNKEELKTEWLKLFSGSAKRLYKKRIGKQFEFRISPRMYWSPILVFKDEVEHLDTLTKLSKLEISEPQVYSRRYGFEPFNSTYLINMVNADTSKYDSLIPHKFSVYFSKPVNNFLLAAVDGWDERIATPNSKRYGRSMFILFIFRKDESLEKVFYSYVDR